MPKGIKKNITKKEVIENNLEGVVEPGDEIIIPTEEEVVTEDWKEYRECTCGAMVKLPDNEEDTTLCECGVKHKR